MSDNYLPGDTRQRIQDLIKMIFSLPEIFFAVVRYVLTLSKRFVLSLQPLPLAIQSDHAACDPAVHRIVDLIPGPAVLKIEDDLTCRIDFCAVPQ